MQVFEISPHGQKLLRTLDLLNKIVYVEPIQPVFVSNFQSYFRNAQLPERREEDLIPDKDVQFPFVVAYQERRKKELLLLWAPTENQR